MSLHLGCGGTEAPPVPDAPPEPAPAAAPTPAPDAAAVGAWCDFLEDFDPDSISDVSDASKQTAMLTAFEAHAAQASVDVESFVTTLAKLDPSERQAWVASGIEAHDLGARCEAAR